MANQLRGNDLRQLGFPEGRAIGLALAQLQRKHLKKLSHTDQLALLTGLLAAPADFLTHLDWSAVAAALLPAPDRHIALVERKDYAVFGAEHIDPGAIHQMETAMKLPVTVAGALMPDAHHGYGLPIGGVLATDNAVIPYAVGVDIGCRMALSVFELPPRYLTQRTQELRHLLLEHTRFGSGRGFERGQRLDHAVLDRAEFRDIPFLRNKLDKAAEQVGTSGSGNHFVEFGVVEITDPANELGVPVGQYLGLLSHSGSRGLGAGIAERYTKLAKDVCQLPGEAQHLAWLGLDTEAGQEYWAAMTLAGDYASACHEQIHRRLARALGEKPLAKVENHHNFCIAAGERVATPTGPRAIEALQVNDVVYVPDPTLGLVEARLLRAGLTGHREVVTVRTRGRAIRCTADHQLLTLDAAVGWQWRPAAEIRLGDQLVCAESYFREEEAVDEGAARLFGAFLGDGWVRQEARKQGYSVGLAIGGADEEHTGRYQTLLQRLFPAVAWKNNGAGAYGLTCSSKQVYTWLQQQGLAGTSHTKRLPARAFQFSRAARLALLAGYVDADGSVSANPRNRGRAKLLTVNLPLLQDLRELALSCGLDITPIGSTDMHTNYGRCRAYFCTLGAAATAQLPLWHDRKRERLNHTARLLGRNGALPAGLLTQRVTSITAEPMTVDVYDVTVDHPQHAFVCEGVVVHNCWKEEVNGRELYVHRKGATPAGSGVLGIIPGSMTAPGFIVRGRNGAGSLASASHGAGRLLSRTRAKAELGEAQVRRYLADHGIELIGGGLDEAPQAYKDIRQVMASQRELVDVLGSFTPRIVRMDGA